MNRRCELCLDDEETCYCYDDKPRTDDETMSGTEPEYILLRRNYSQHGWKRTVRGSRSFILDVLRLNLESPVLREFEWSVRKVKP